MYTGSRVVLQYQSLACATLVAVSAIPAIAASTSGSTATSSASRDVISLRFDRFRGALGSAQTSFHNSGSASVRFTMIKQAGGQVRSVSSRAGYGRAIAFPKFDIGPHPVRAVMDVEPEPASSGALDPSSADFSWGADFKIDAVSASGASGSTDNGDNLVQRGLFSAAHSQFKLEVDHHRPACVLRGSTGIAGQARVRVPVTVKSQTWYSAGCQRLGQELTITLQKLGGGGAVTRTWSVTKTSPIGFGSVSWSNKSVPLTVGGKVTSHGTIDSPSSDQFNGVVDNVFLRIRG